MVTYGMRRMGGTVTCMINEEIEKKQGAKGKMYVISLQRSPLLHPSARKMCDDETTSDNHPSGEKGIGYTGVRQFRST